MSEQQSQEQMVQEALASSIVEPAADAVDVNELNSQMLVEELTTLGAQFARLAQAAWNSADRKALEERLRERLEANANRIWSTWEQNSRPLQIARKIGDTAESASNTMLDVSVVNYSAKTVLALIHALGEQVESLAVQMESGEPLFVDKVRSVANAAQDIMIEDAEPAQPPKARKTRPARSQTEEKADDTGPNN